jgi:predicted RNA-binding protein YlxR (DUF448 family)
MARLTVVEGRVVPWSAAARPPGRGASIHPDERCVREAVRVGAFSRAFRTRVEGVEVSEFLRSIII